MNHRKLQDHQSLRTYRGTHRAALCLLAWFVVVLTVVTAHAQQVEIRIRHRVSGEDLRLDSGVYHNALGQHFRVERFRYYLSDFSWVSAQGQSTTDSASYLVDQEDTASMLLHPHLPAAQRLSALRFIIGVDSAHNCAGLQEGALDPVQGMFWAWNTGYIFLKLDGRSDQSRENGSLIEYHIGGFQWPNNCIREIALPFASELSVAQNDTLLIDVDVDLGALFDGAHRIDFHAMPSVTDATHATLIADNYAHMIRLRSVRVARRDTPHEKH